jgi:hypothetical protein
VHKCLVIVFGVWPFGNHVINLPRLNGGSNSDSLKVHKCHVIVFAFSRSVDAINLPRVNGGSDNDSLKVHKCLVIVFAFGRSTFML